MLPDWPPGTAAILATAGDAPHAIPVSTALRAGERQVLLALGPRRGSLARLRADPRVALTVLAGGNVAFTAHGRASGLGEVAGGVVAVRLDVDDVQDHTQPAFVVEDGVRWRWTDAEAERRDRTVRDALGSLARP